MDLITLIEESPRLSSQTKRAYSYAVNRWLSFIGPDPRSWTLENCKLFYRHLLTQMKPQSANKLMWGLRYVGNRYSKISGQQNFADQNVVELASTPSANSKHSLNSQEVKDLLKVCDGEAPIDLRDLAITSTAVATGMRRSSLCGMTFEGLKKIDDIWFASVPIKGGKIFPVPLASLAIEALQPWIKWLKKNQIISGPIFRSVSLKRMDGSYKIGTALSEDGLYRAILKRSDLAGVNHFSPHIFRHTFITWCQLKDFGEELKEFQIASITGHSVVGSGVIDSTYTDKQMIAKDALSSVERVLSKALS